MNLQVKRLSQDPYPDAKSDLFACFIERGYTLTKVSGFSAMVTMESWMFLSSFERMRNRLLLEKTIVAMAHLSGGIVCGFGTVVSILRNCRLPAHVSSYSFTSQDDLNSDGVPYEFPLHNSRLKTVDQGEFEKIPGSPIAYFVSTQFRRTFETGRPLETISPTRLGMTSSDNARFVRLWFEVSYFKVGFEMPTEAAACISGKKWFPYNKGGGYRKWFGNNLALVNWENGGQEVLQYAAQVTGGSPTKQIRSRSHFFRRSVTWSFIGGTAFGVRANEQGFIFDVGGSSTFPPAEKYWLVLGLLASKLSFGFLQALNPTLNFQAGNVASIPFIEPIKSLEVGTNAQAAMDLARDDWDAYERSWAFQSFRLLSASIDPSPTLESSYTAWIANNKQTIAEMKRLEEENNRLFIDAYGLQDELTPDVPIEQITLTVNPAYRYGGNLSEDELWNRFRQDTIKELLSYATGCMMGRYSLDHPGLILANAGDTLENYVAKVGKSGDAVAFQPDRDGIIPVLDGEWFEDDIVARSREFLRVCFPASSLNTDLAFIETSLGKDIRKFFCSDFYKDHLQTYKKRPIYWLVQSPAGPAKGGFACLIYLHRYTKDTLNLVLNNYFRPYLQKLEARQAQLGLDQLNDALPTRDRTAARKEAEKITKVLKDCQAWEQDALLPLAQQRIELDLDDGVKVNYLKLQDVLAPIPGLAAKEE